MDYDLSDFKTRVLTCGFFIGAGVAATLVPDVSALALPGIAAAGSIAGNVFATDLLESLNRRPQKRREALGYPALVQAVGETIGGIIGEFAKEGSRDHRIALRKMASAAPESWGILAKLNDERLAELSENQIQAYFSTPADQFHRLTALEPETWERFIHWLAEGQKVSLSKDAVSHLARRLYETLPLALRKTLTAGFDSGGQAYADLQLMMIGEIRETLSNIDVNLRTLSDEERSRYEQIIKLLDEVLRYLSGIASPPAPKTTIFNAPSDNPTFSGRETILASLHAALQENRRVALTGMPGVGKTQIAIEYAHRHRDDYPSVLWINAAADYRDDAKKAKTHPDTSSSADSRLMTEYLSLARQLNLPEANLTEAELAILAVKQWLEANPGWLLVFDNADDSEALTPFLPSVSQGFVLVTSRESARWESEIEVSEMKPEEGAECLLRCAQIAAPTPDERKIARELSVRMDGLPLALDQAGAYVNEKRMSLSRYRELYDKRSADLLKERGRTTTPYAHSVHVTFALAFEQVGDANPSSAELLRMCAFLAPDAIPEEIFTEGASALEEPFASAFTDELSWEEGVGTAIRYALLRRDETNRTLSVHRLIQETLREEMAESDQRDWVKRIVFALNRIFPIGEYENWSKCERLISQAQTCADLVRRYALMNQEGSRLLNHAGLFLYYRGRYGKAEPQYLRALAINEESLGMSHPDTAISLNNLAELYRAQSRYGEAEPLYLRALAIREESLGASHPYTATILNNLALLYYTQGCYAEAEPLYQRALAIDEESLGANHPDTAIDLNNLAGLYYAQSRYREAEPLYLRALAIREESLEAKHPFIATSLDNLATLYHAQSRYGEAEPLYQRALAIREDCLGANHPDTATSLNNLAGLYYAQSRYREAEPLYLRALAIREESLEAKHPFIATSLDNLATLYKRQGRYEEAEPLYLHALAIFEESQGAHHPDTATSLDNLAALYHAQFRYDEAEPLYLRALAIREESLGANHPDTAQSLNNLATLCYSQSRYADAESFFRRTITIFEESLGLSHPNTATAYENYAYLLLKLERNEEANQIYLIAQEIRQRHAENNANGSKT